VTEPADRDYNEEGIEMFVALEGVPGEPAARTASDAALARLAAGYLRDPGGSEETAAALERLAAEHFELGT
jgi:hypothetical protein